MAPFVKRPWALQATSQRASCHRPMPIARRPLRAAAIAAPLGPGKQESTNGAGPHRVLAIQATLDDINRALAACIRQAAEASSLDKINKGIGKEISRAAGDRFRQ